MDFGFGVGYSELFVLGIIAVIVIGPKDLPVVLRKFGQIMQRVRGMAREFQSHVDVAMKDTGVSELKKDLQGMQSAINETAKTSVPMSAVNSIAPAIKNDFEKFFGGTTTGAETRVAGSVVADVVTPQL
jgi:sec-independent protein translocase protein TatB